MSRKKTVVQVSDHTCSAASSNNTAHIVGEVIKVLRNQGIIPQVNATLPEHSTEPVDVSNEDVTEILSADKDIHATDAGIQQPILPPRVNAPTALSSYNLHLSALVTDKLKNKIWNNEFVEFSNLNMHFTQQEEVSVQVAGTNISINKPKEMKQLSIGQWLTAFHTFMDVYIQRYPDDMSGLLYYCNLIRDLDRAYGVAAFHFYDRTFRAHRQSQPLPWGVMHTELWVKAATVNATAVVKANAPTKIGKHCINFNKINGCSYRNCRFLHICSHCGKKHPKTQCYALRNFNHTSPATPAALSGHGSVSISQNKSQTQPFRTGTNAYPSKK